jgi:hypothetical protein
MTTGLTFRNVKVEVSIDGGSNWTNISGQTNALTPSGGDRNIGEFYDAQSDNPTLGAGKLGRHQLMLRVKYTETDAQAWRILYDAKEAATPVMVRWSPKGGLSGDYLFTSDEGYVVSCPLPGQEVESGDPMRVEVNVDVSDVNRSVVA